jgi:hypothetical protein
VAPPRASKRVGRPALPRPDLGFAQTGESSLQHRIAWLLRINRLYGNDQQWLASSTFAKAFQGGCWPDEVTASRISRWETASVRAPYRAIRRYEELLALAPNTLVSVVDGLYRFHTAAIGPSPLDRHVLTADEGGAERRVEELVERVCFAETATASEWDELTTYVAALPSLVLIPRSRWDEIAQRLLLETIVSTGAAWLSRYEAFCRLMGHPRGQHAAIAACMALVADRTNLVFVETVCTLEGSRHPDAGAHVIAQLTQPTNEQAFYGALLACVRKTKFNHFTAAQRGELAHLLQSIMIDDPYRYEEVRTVAAQLYRQVAGEVGTSFEVSLRRAARADPAVEEVLSTGRLLEDRRAAIIVSRVVDRALAMRPHDGGGYHDGILANLVTDLLFHPVLDARLYAGLLIGASPYAPLLASSLASELTSASAVLSNVNLSRCVFGALRMFGGPAQRPIVERYVLETPLAPVAEAATFAIGHIGGASGDAFWRRAVDRATQAYERRPTPTNLRALSNLVYALGIARNDTMLGSLRRDESSAVVRSAAAWWMNLPRRVYEGAMH